jgi:hypothetical protein
MPHMFPFLPLLQSRNRRWSRSWRKRTATTAATQRLQMRKWFVIVERYLGAPIEYPTIKNSTSFQKNCSKGQVVLSWSVNTFISILIPTDDSLVGRIENGRSNRQSRIFRARESLWIPKVNNLRFSSLWTASHFLDYISATITINEMKWCVSSMNYNTL